ncbi:acyl-CoA dehydrogenase family protein [Patulibacter sp.]|uniref:acyl-CoA dehydrogenase family protein n=1 Tax=Patulibacter sp. TaxID=1912859 RepID=UPI002724CB4E|nr:acyl-CoA dehydrogenase family protein [Patulibacter sp.]MDO9407823.1 acyl-CoA dehydrogenase family protein [Patulibacter sp.]
MDFSLTPRVLALREELSDFVEHHVIPAEATFRAQALEGGQPPVMEELKAEARRRGLTNLFLPAPLDVAPDLCGPGLSNVEYASLAEVMGRSRLAPEACNCNAPDTGNMEVLAHFGTPEQQEQWLVPLLRGEIRSGFAMTEPDVASSDATNIQLRIDTDGDEYVLNGRKWWTTGAMHGTCRILIVMGRTDPDGDPHRRQSMVLVPMDTPGVELVRGLPVFGYHDPGGHGEIRFTDVRVPRSNILAEEGDGFRIGQARLGPGRVHHCMRAIGAAERALELLCARAKDRHVFGSALAERANVQDWIAQSRIEIDMARLLVLHTAWLIDTVGSREARAQIAAIKVAAADVACRVVDRAIQIHGGAGVSDDFPLASMYAHLRTLRLADGPDEVHRRTVAQFELRRTGRPAA